MPTDKIQNDKIPNDKMPNYKSLYDEFPKTNCRNRIMLNDKMPNPKMPHTKMPIESTLIL
jgi:hypothetical protein